MGYYEQALASDLSRPTGKTTRLRYKWLRTSPRDPQDNNLGRAYHALGQYAKAMGYYEQALVAFEKSLEKEHPSTKWVRENIAAVTRH